MSTTEQPADASWAGAGRATAASDRSTHPLVYQNMIVLFAVVICCFTAWGIAADMTAPMVAAFKRTFTMSTFQASLVQFAYYGAYFALALPAAFINQRFGYKTGLLTGLGLASLGALFFYPASKIMTYSVFLVALFALAAGLSILETSANPFVISMGPEANSTRRLNLAQAFNPVGTNIGVLLATVLVLPKLNSPIDRASVTPEQLRTIQAAEPKGSDDPGGISAGKPQCRAARRDHWAALGKPTLPIRRHSAVLQHRHPGVHLDVHDPVCRAGPQREPGARRFRTSSPRRKPSRSSSRASTTQSRRSPRARTSTSSTRPCSTP